MALCRKITFGFGMLIAVAVISCNQGETSSAKQATDFSGEELYQELTDRTMNKKAGDSTATGFAPLNSELAKFSDEQLYAALSSVYGIDNRKNRYDSSITDNKILDNADRVACLMDTSSLQQLPDGNYEIKVKEYYTQFDNKNLCTGETFYGEPLVGFGSGFAVSKSMFATAGHALNANNLSSAVFVYGFRIKKDGTPNLWVSKNDVFYPVKIAQHQLDEATKQDFCLVTVNKVIGSERICEVRRNGKIPDNEQVYVAGYPMGMPLKIVPAGHVLNNSFQQYFVTNLDTYHGNSGSPVFNGKSHIVEGILVRGEDDFQFWDIGKCERSRICPDNGAGCKGEDVTRASQFAVWIK